jgi:polysaccharide biosynthesis protein PslJ
LVFKRMRADSRVAIIATLMAGALLALSIPVIRDRFLNTGSDRGSLDRTASLADYPRVMSGSWWFGKGWGLDEFINASAAYKTNHVANSPLLSVYRGGLLVGLAFVAVLVIGLFIAYRNLHKKPWESCVIGAQFVGFTIVGLQLDFPVVTHATMAMAWSVFIVLLVANPVTPTSAPPVAPTATAGRHRSRADA